MKISSSPKNIALIANEAISLSNFRGPLIRDMVSAGHFVYGLAPDFDRVTREKLISCGGQPVDISLDASGVNPIRDLSDIIGLWRTLRNLRPDIVFSRSFKPIIYGTIAAYLARVPSSFAMIEGMGFFFTEGNRKPSLKTYAVKMIIKSMMSFAKRNNEVFFFLNRDDLKFFFPLGEANSDRAILIGGIGVDLKYYTTDNISTQEPLTFLLIARLLREKGIEDYIAAARMIKRRNPSIRFLLLGGLHSNPGGFKRNELEEWVREGVVSWHDHVDDVRPFIEEASVFVLPSYREGVPRSTQEAMAMGRAVITTDSVGCRDTVEHGVNGFLVPVRDPDALAAAMQRFIDEPKLIVSMGKESRRLAEERFDVRKINEKILSAMNLST